MKNVVVIGSGVLGSQIAFQCAYLSKKVNLIIQDESQRNDALEKLNNLKNNYLEDINKMSSKDSDVLKYWCFGISNYEDFNKELCIKNVENAINNINISVINESIISNADIIIESVTENISVKKSVFENISKYVNNKTIVVTNSSTMLPSKLSKFIKYPNRFLSMHFANTIWKNNIVEVMRHSKTDDDAFKSVISFGKSINMVALPLNKEKSGYLLNSMLIPLLFSGLDLLVNGISDVESIDKAWTLGTGSPKGPFQILDTVGLNTAYEIVKMYVNIPSFLAPYNFKGMEKLLKEYIDKGKLGKSTKEGFYKYKN